MSEKLLQSLDTKTASHLKLCQEENWFKPLELAKESNLYFTSKGKSYAYVKNVTLFCPTAAALK